MNDLARIIKQLITVLLFIIILIILGYAGYKVFKSEPVATPSPTPEIVAIKILSQALIESSPGTYDYIASINNPNGSQGVSSADYTLDFIDKAGLVYARRLGELYILPGQTKYLVESQIESNVLLSSANLKITNLVWKSPRKNIFDGYKLNVKTPTLNKRFLNGKNLPIIF